MHHRETPNLNKTRILQVIDHLFAGGAQELIVRLAESVNRARFDMEVCCLHGWGTYADRLVATGVSVYSLGQSKYTPLLPTRFTTLLQEKRPHILHLHLEASTLLGAVIGRLVGTSHIITTIHTSYAHRPRLWLWLIHAIFPLIDRYVVETSLGIQELTSAGIPADKVVCIRRGVRSSRVLSNDQESSLKSRIAIRAQFGIGMDDPLLINVARLHPDKDQESLLHAMSLIVERLPSARLIIVGEGPLRATLERMVKRFGLSAHVFMPGFTQKVMDFYMAGDVYILSSCREGLPVTLLEAMMCSLPIIAFDVGAVNEVVLNGQTGLLVHAGDVSALADAAVSLLTNSKRARRLGNMARQMVLSQRTVERMIREYEALYDELTEL